MNAFEKWKRDYAWRREQFASQLASRRQGFRFGRYLPAILAYLFAYLFIRFPVLASAVLGGGLIFVGTMYLLFMGRVRSFASWSGGFDQRSQGGAGFQRVKVWTNQGQWTSEQNPQTHDGQEHDQDPRLPPR